MTSMLGNLVKKKMENVVVSDSRKHSNLRGKSPVTALVKSIMVCPGSPMRIDMNNIGSFIPNGKR